MNQLTEFNSLDANEAFVLEQLSKYWGSKQKITVSEATAMFSRFSNSTSHRYLKNLRIKGYIQLVVDETDNRVKYVSSTELTQTYFSKLGEALLQAADR